MKSQRKEIHIRGKTTQKLRNAILYLTTCFCNMTIFALMRIWVIFSKKFIARRIWISSNNMMTAEQGSFKNKDWNKPDTQSQKARKTNYRKTNTKYSPSHVEYGKVVLQEAVK